MVRAMTAAGREAYLGDGGAVLRFACGDTCGTGGVPCAYLCRAFALERVCAGVCAGTGRPACRICAYVPCLFGGSGRQDALHRGAVCAPGVRRDGGCEGAFFTYLERYALSGIARLRLEVVPDNEGARRLYARHGFVSLPYAQMVRELEPAGGAFRYRRRAHGLTPGRGAPRCEGAGRPDRRTQTGKASRRQRRRGAFLLPISNGRRAYFFLREYGVSASGRLLRSLPS